MGNSVSSTSSAWSLSQTSQSSGSVSSSLSTVVAASPSNIVTLVETAENGQPSCGSSGSPCCLSAECSGADSGYGPTLTTTVTSEECTDEPEAETLSSSTTLSFTTLPFITSSSSTTASFTCVDWSCISSVVGEAGSSLCATTYTPWIETSTVYEWCPETSRHRSSSRSPATFSVLTVTTSTSSSSYTTPDWPWPSTNESCDYEDPWGDCPSTTATTTTTRFHYTPTTAATHHSLTTESPECAYEDCVQGARSRSHSRLHSHSYSHLRSHSHSRSRSSSFSHHFTVKTPPKSCHPPHCGAPPTESTGSEVWPQTTMPTAQAARSSEEADMSGV